MGEVSILEEKRERKLSSRKREERVLRREEREIWGERKV